MQDFEELFIILEEFSIFRAQKKIASAEILPTNAIFSFL